MDSPHPLQSLDKQTPNLGAVKLDFTYISTSATALSAENSALLPLQPIELPPPADELKTSKTRCNHPTCTLKLGIMDRTVECKCHHVFCGKHRFGDTKNHDGGHKCLFDYKGATIKLLAATNEKVIGERVVKI
jgi:hypothetical protein